MKIIISNYHLQFFFCKRKDKILKIQNIYFENVFIREKKNQNQIKIIQIVWLLAYHTSARN